MDDFIAKTLRGETPATKTLQRGGVTIEWLDEGILQLTPAGEVRGALVVSAGIHGNETAPVEMLEQLLAPLVRSEQPLVWRLLVVLGSPAALRAGRRFIDYDLNRLFGGRWQTAAPGVETARAERLEQALETFFAAGDETVRWHLDLHTAIRASRFPRFGVLPARTTAWPEDFLAWLGAPGYRRWYFIARRAAPSRTFPASASQHSAVRWSLGRRCRSARTISASSPQRSGRFWRCWTARPRLPLWMRRAALRWRSKSPGEAIALCCICPLRPKILRHSTQAHCLRKMAMSAITRRKMNGCCFRIPLSRSVYARD